MLEHEQGQLVGIVEKPTALKSNLKGCGLYAFQPDIFDAVARTPRTALRDEYELSVSLELYIQSGHPVYAEEIIEWDYNFTRPEDVLKCNLRWLAQQRRNQLIGSESHVDEGTALHQVVIGNQARVSKIASLKEAVVFSGASLERGGAIEWALVTPERLYFLEREREGSPL
jgi:dTDP-glucose pyrophosphorylase